MLTTHVLIKNSRLKSWNFTIDERPLAITGRVLESPPLIAARKETIRARDGVFDLRGKHFVQPARIARWQVIHFATMIGTHKCLKGCIGPGK